MRASATPAPTSTPPPARLKPRRTAGRRTKDDIWPASNAYSSAFSAASATKLATRTAASGRKGAEAEKNCGTKATKKAIPYGFSAVTA